MSLINILKEALPLNMAKQYTSYKNYRKNTHKNLDRYISETMEKLKSVEGAKWSKRGDRVYIPFTAEQKTIEEKMSDEVVANIRNLHKFIQDVTDRRMDSSDYDIDYVNGTIYIKHEKRTYKLIKYLNKLTSDALKRFDYSPDNSWMVDTIKSNLYGVTKDYNNIKGKGEFYKPKNEYYIVFSSHPYDIAGMSTDRGWRSCMTLFYNDKNGEGENANKVRYDISEGSIIAYLIKTDDINIKNPTARILIPIYVNSKNDYVYFPNHKVYGTAPKDFLFNVTKILEDVQGEKEGFYSQFACRYADNISKGKRFYKIKPPSDFDLYFTDPNYYINSKNEFDLFYEYCKQKQYDINEYHTFEFFEPMGKNDPPFFVEMNTTNHLMFKNVKKMTKLPFRIGASISILRLTNCNIDTFETFNLPEYIYQIFARNNNLKNFNGIPENIGLLDFTNNNINSLKGIENFPNLKVLMVVDNPITSIDDLPQDTQEKILNMNDDSFNSDSDDLVVFFQNTEPYNRLNGV